MQAFWVIQPRRNNPVIQLEKVLWNRIFLSAEDAKEELAILQEDDDCYTNHEVVALVADWPPSQFDKKDAVDRHLEEILQSFSPEDVEEVEQEEPDWLTELRSISDVVKDLEESTLNDMGLCFLATALTAYEGQIPLEIEIQDGPRWRISFVPKEITVMTLKLNNNV